MLRAIVRRKQFDAHSGMESTDLITLDFDNSELESHLRRGGRGEAGYDITELVGIEIVGPAPSDDRMSDDYYAAVVNARR